MPSFQALLAAANCFILLFATLEDQDEWQSFRADQSFLEQIWGVYHVFLLNEAEVRKADTVVLMVEHSQNLSYGGFGCTLFPTAMRNLQPASQCALRPAA